jgi:hypothetical protein
MTTVEPNADKEPAAGHRRATNHSDVILFWAVRLVSTLGVVAVIWAAIATGDMLVHGHPAYSVLLGLLFIVCTVVAIRSWRRHTPGHRRFKVLGALGLLVSCGVLALAGWLVPYSAEPAARSAMVSDGTITVTESPTQILMTPTGTPSDVGVFFQPGALVDARAYAAVLRPLAENGHTVVIPKQPFGIAFLSTRAFNTARTEHRSVDRWVLGGHSLGGVVAAINAQSAAKDPGQPVAGVLFFASYPSSDISTLPVPMLSISASNDSLTTPEKIEASRSFLPQDTTFTEIEGGVHANFGDYGTQSGDGEPTVSRDEARTEISAASLAFVQSLGR